MMRSVIAASLCLALLLLLGLFSCERNEPGDAMGASKIDDILVSPAHPFVEHGDPADTQVATLTTKHTGLGENPDIHYRIVGWKSVDTFQVKGNQIKTNKLIDNSILMGAHNALLLEAIHTPNTGEAVVYQEKIRINVGANALPPAVKDLVVLPARPAVSDGDEADTDVAILEAKYKGLGANPDIRYQIVDWTSADTFKVEGNRLKTHKVIKNAALLGAHSPITIRASHRLKGGKELAFEKTFVVMVASNRTPIKARYKLRFHSTWSSTTHPTNYPPNPHYSPLVGATHQASFALWTPGKLASEGLEEVAETGSTTTISKEIQTAITNTKTVHAVLKGSGLNNGTGVVEMEFDVWISHPFVSVVSMLAPSPDWFVGVHGLPLYDNQAWVQSKTVSLLLYDAGTDSGVRYRSDNADTNPAETISRLTSKEGDTDFRDGKPAVGTFTFTRLSTD